MLWRTFVNWKRLFALIHCDTGASSLILNSGRHTYVRCCHWRWSSHCSRAYLYVYHMRTYFVDTVIWPNMVGQFLFLQQNIHIFINTYSIRHFLYTNAIRDCYFSITIYIFILVSSVDELTLSSKSLIILWQICEYRKSVGHFVHGHIGGIKQCWYA